MPKPTRRKHSASGLAITRKRVAKLPKIHILDTEARWKPNIDEMLWWPRVQWIDPGTVSGVAVLWFDPKAVFSDQPTARQILGYSEMYLSGPESGLNGQVNRFLRLRRTLAQETGLATGCESFVPRQLNMDWEFLAPVRIRAALDYALSKTTPFGQELVGQGVTLHVQTPSDAIRSFTNDRLKMLRMYTPGPDHLNDAKRHCLLWLRKIRRWGREKFEELHGNEKDWWKEA